MKTLRSLKDLRLSGLVAATAISVLISACGGGGGSSSAASNGVSVSKTSDLQDGDEIVVTWEGGSKRIKLLSSKQSGETQRFYGSSEDTETLNSIVTYNTATKALGIQTSTEDETVYISQDASGELSASTEAHGEVNDLVVPNPDASALSVKSAKAVNANDVTADGTQIIDMAMYYAPCTKMTTQKDMWQRSLEQVDSVNTSLRNSGIDDIEVRLVGVDAMTADFNNTVSGPGLSKFTNAYRASANSYGADLYVGVSCGGGYAGMAYVPGHASVTHFHYRNAFKHEVGHNVGGGHCPGSATSHYKHGHLAARTNMCGNSVLHYSNPDIKIGSVATGAANANMARLWREQKTRLAGRLKRVLPLEDDVALTVNFQTGRVSFSIPNNSLNAGVQYRLEGNGKYIGHCENAVCYYLGKQVAGDTATIATTVGLGSLNDLTVTVKNQHGNTLFEKRKLWGNDYNDIAQSFKLSINDLYSELLLDLDDSVYKAGAMRYIVYVDGKYQFKCTSALGCVNAEVSESGGFTYASARYDKMTAKKVLVNVFEGSLLQTSKSYDLSKDFNVTSDNGAVDSFNDGYLAYQAADGITLEVSKGFIGAGYEYVMLFDGVEVCRSSATAAEGCALDNTSEVDYVYITESASVSDFKTMTLNVYDNGSLKHTKKFTPDML